MAEWFMAPVLKTGKGESPSQLRILFPPPTTNPSATRRLTNMSPLTETKLRRCGWAQGDPLKNDLLMQTYHDQEWGIPLHDDRKLFEFLILEIFQAGLS